MTNDVSGSKHVAAEENLRGRLSGGQSNTAEYEGSLGVLESHYGHVRGRRGPRPKLLVAGLAAAALLTVGAGAVYAQGGFMISGNGAESEVDGGGMDGMMNGGKMGSMMGGQGADGMGSMMGNGEGMDSMMNGQGMMGSFDEKRPFDLQFIDQMIMHHEGAIMSSEHMISDSKRPELRKLAEEIRESQSEQVEQMKAMREQWYPDAERTFGMMDPTRMEEMMGDGMMGGSMREMMGGDATDEMFLEMMIPHHQMAVDMSEKALEEAEHPKLKDLARKIEDEQTAEIELMEGYLEEIENSDGS
ncbi:MAG: DUF305 domain-containing protein [Actinomycetota bacterium]|nr:DUF305 domain-containing protein [Actinomycetota bacterium]